MSAARIRIIPHEAVPGCGSFEVKFPSRRESVYFHWDEVASRRLKPEQMTKAKALRKARELARAEQHKLDSHLLWREPKSR
jgi:hypothetical protein